MAERQKRTRTSFEDSLDPAVLEIVRENQLRADRIGRGILWCLILFSVLSLIATLFVADGAALPLIEVRLFIGIGYLLLCQVVSLALYRRIGDRNRWYRHFAVAALIVYALYEATAVSVSIVNLVLPVLLSCRYLDRRFTARVALISLICVPIATFGLVAFDMQDQYYLIFPENPADGYVPFGGTGLFEGAVPYDLWATYANVLVFDTSIVAVVVVLAGAVCYTYADRGLRNLTEQAEAARRQARRESEMDMAARMRQSVLSTDFDIAPDYVDLYARAVSPKRIGGSFYDFASPGPSALGFAMGDTESDDRVAVLRMMESVGMFRGLSASAMSVGGVARALNDRLRAHNSERHRLSLFIGLLNLETGVLSYVDADFPGFCLVRNGRLVVPERQQSPAIGAENVHRFYTNALTLRPGDILVLYTQGFLGNRDGAGNLITPELMERCFTWGAAEGGTARAVCEGVLSNEAMGVCQEGFEKDCSVMAIRFLQPNASHRFMPRGARGEFEAFAVFVVATDVEFDLLFSQYAWTLLGVNESGYLSYRARCERDGRVRELVLMRQRGAGMVAAADLAANAIWRFHPQYIVSVGVAAGLNAEGLGSGYGDVVVGSTVFDYSSGRYVEACRADIAYGSVGFVPQPQSITLPEWLVGSLRAACAGADCAWKVHIGPLACGVAVVENYEVCEKQVLSQYPDAVGLDMESYGIAYACRYAPGLKTFGITIKGIADFADAQRGYDHQEEAAAASCGFARLCVERYLPDRQQEPCGQ